MSFAREPDVGNVLRTGEEIVQHGNDFALQIRVEKQLHWVTLSLS